MELNIMKKHISIKTFLAIFLLTLMTIAVATPIVTAVSNGKIAFVSNRDGNDEIYSMNADGTGQTRLTNNTASDVNPAWSSDGTRIAFVSNRDGNNEIYVMNADGSNQQRLTSSTSSDINPTWSPDGTRIAFATNRDTGSWVGYEVYVMNANGSNQQRLTNNTVDDVNPTWSPDGTRIAFITNKDGNYEIYVMNADGSNPQRRTNNTASDGNPAWSPDGTKIAFVRNSGTWVADIYITNAYTCQECTGTAPTDLSQSPSADADPAFSPDGTKIAFATSRDGNYEIYIMNPDGSEQIRVTNNTASDRELSWQPISATLLPGISINDITLTEPNSGTRNFVFTVTRSGNTTGVSSVNFSTANGTAIAPSDYTSNSGTITFAAGETTKNVTIMVNSDTTIEPDETFFVNLSNCIGCSITDNHGVGTILNGQLLELFNVYISPDINTIGLGSSKKSTITINNYGSAASNYNISISGLNDTWYTLERTNVNLNPGEISNVNINITLPSTCSISETSRNFSAYVSSVVTNATESDQAELRIDSGHSINNLLPVNRSRLSSTDIAITWDTYGNATTEVYYRAQNEANYTAITGANGRQHFVRLFNLSRNTWYAYYVRSNTSCGSSESAINYFFIDNGISFTQKIYSFNINRDYDQRVQVTVKNTDSKPHRLLMHVTNPYDDLIGNFVGSGSEDQIITLSPGQSMAETLALHAQDALLGSYKLGLNLTNIDDNTTEYIHDFAIANINVYHPYINFSIDEMSSDNITLKKKFRITNYGDTITDLKVSIDDEHKNSVFFEPSINHGYLQKGGMMEFEAVPALVPGTTGFTATISVSGAGEEVNKTTNFNTPEGERIFVGISPPLNIKFLEPFDADGINYTNPPEESVLAPFVVGNTVSLLGKVGVLVEQFNRPVSGANVSLILRYDYPGNSNVTTIYGTSNLFGVASFTIFGPPGNYSYSAELTGIGKTTETRNFSVNEIPFKSFQPFSVIWTNASEANISYEINNSMNLTLDSPPFVIKAKKTGLKPDSVAEIYFKDSAGITDFESAGEISGDEIIFNISSIDPGEYSALIMISDPTEIATSIQKTFIFTENASIVVDLNPDYVSVLPFKANGTDVDFVRMKHVTKEQDGSKLFKLINIEPVNSTTILLTYAIAVNKTMSDDLHLNVTINGNVIYRESRTISFMEFEPEFVELYIPVNLNTQPAFNISFIMEDPSSFEEVFTLEPRSIYSNTENFFSDNQFKAQMQVFTSSNSNMSALGNPFEPHTKDGVIAKCIGRFIPGVGTVMGAFDIGYAMKEIAASEGIEAIEKTIETVGGISETTIEPLSKIETKRIVKDLLGRIGDKNYRLIKIKEYKHLRNLLKLAGPLNFIGNVGSNIEDWNRVVEEGGDWSAFGINILKKIKDWYCTNRPVINNTFNIPPTVPSILNDGTPNVDMAYIIPDYTLPWPENSYKPHNVDILLNGQGTVGLTNTIPNGYYQFSMDPSLLNFGSGLSSGINTITTSTTHLNGGHYIVSSNMRVIVHYKIATLSVSAKNQSDADNKILGMVDQFTGNPDLVINQREIIAPTNAPLGESGFINITVHNYGTQVAGDVLVQLQDNDTVMNKTIFYLPVGGSYNMSFDWKPSTSGQHTISIKLNPDKQIQEIDYSNNEASKLITVGSTSDNIPPQSISNPVLQAAGTTWLKFAWTNPLDPDFSQVMLYLNGSFKTSVQAPENYYNFTGLNPDTLYELGTHTVDTSGNINLTWVNATMRTASEIITPTPSITVVSPNGSENWTIGTTQMIRWTYSGTPGSFVNITLLKGGIFDRTINSSTSIGSSGSGSYTWLINPAQAMGTDYKIMVTSITNSSYNDTSNNFTINASAILPINVISPNGGENWTRGKTQIINWTSTGSPGTYVKIELLKAGVLNSVIIASTLNDGSHSWLIPATQTPGTDYKIRITNTSNSSYTDTSDNNFTIPAPNITVTAPNAGETWRRGTTQTIKWNSSGSPGTYVKIELLKGGVLNRLIIASTVNDGSHPWLIPATLAPGTDYKVRITSTTNAAYNDTSDANFTIPVPSITIVTPDGGENWTRGTTKIINWNSTESPGTYVKIELLKAGTLNRVVIASTLNDGSHPWVIPATLVPGKDYKVKITSIINISNSDTSDNNFTIPTPSINVVSPNGAENWTRGTTKIITWNSTESPGSYVKIELLRPGKPNQLIISATLNDGSHPWLIPAAQAPGSDYKVKITSAINASNNDTSDDNFMIPAPSFKVVSPNGGENWIRGSTQIIKWNSTESPGTYVKIELLKGGVLNRVIIASTINDGSHPWIIPATQTPGDDYKVRITSTANVSNTDTSDANFTIPVPSITVVTPNGAENWTRGTTRIINWSSTESPGSYVKIELLKSGVLNRVIIASTINDGSHPWLIPVTQATGSDYRVKITSTINILNNDAGNNDFTIGS
ncbi:MAG: hypothetical protein FIB07_13230 [Candidatus Methanoperedens sp.]|nr:hypothetical protein [Candidatus Methanoperedens sp.]